MKILVVEDDIKIAGLLREGLSSAGFDVQLAVDGQIAQGLLGHPENFDLVILDLMLPGVDGISLLQQVRRAERHLPVVILSARHTTDDRVVGLQLGADDYVIKPFSFTELLIRIQNLLRRHPKVEAQSVLELDDLRVDLFKREVFRAGRKIELHIKEFTLLTYLLKNRGQVISKALLLKEVWGYDFDPQTNVVDVLVCRLRNKIDRDFDIRLIHTIRGLGYVCRKN